MICPKCKHKQENIVECESCGAIFERCYKIVLDRKSNEAVFLYNEKKYDKSLEILKYIQRANIYNNKELLGISTDYIAKIQCEIDALKKQSVNEIKDTEITKKRDVEYNKKQDTDNKEKIISIISPLKNVIQPASYVSIILLFVLFLYLRFEYNEKFKKISEEYNEKNNIMKRIKKYLN